MKLTSPGRIVSARGRAQREESKIIPQHIRAPLAARPSHVDFVRHKALRQLLGITEVRRHQVHISSLLSDGHAAQWPARQGLTIMVKRIRVSTDSKQTAPKNGLVWRHT